MRLPYISQRSFFNRLLGITFAASFIFAPQLCAQEVADTKMPAAATQALEARDWEKLITELAQTGAWNTDPNALYWLGMAYYQTEKYKEGSGVLWKAWKAEPDNIHIARMLCRCNAEAPAPKSVRDVVLAFQADGEIHHFAGMVNIKIYMNHKSVKDDLYVKMTRNAAERAYHHFVTAERLGYDEARNHRALAFVYNRRDEHEDAIKHARRAIALEPVGAEVHMLLASSLIQLKRFPEALTAYEDAYLLAPNKKSYFEYERGLALYKASLFSEAAEAFQVALAADRYHNSVRYWIGKAAYAAQNYRLAIWAFGESAAIDENVSAYHMLGRCAYDLENDALAEHYFRLTLEKGKAFYNKKTKKPQAHWSHYLGRALWEQGKKEEALQHLTDAVISDDDNVLYARWLFQCHLQNDDALSALKVCRRLGMAGWPDIALEGIETVMKKWPMPRFQDRAAGKPPHFAVAALYSAEICYEYRRYHQALHFYEKLRQTKGKYAATKAGWCQIQTGKFADAEQCFRDYIEHRPEEKHPYGEYGLAYILASQGKVDEAKAMGEKLKLPAHATARDSLLVWCAQQKKDTTALGEKIDLYTALGIYSRRTRSKGLRVSTLLPNSVLTKTEPRIEHGDIIRRVGDFYLGSAEQMKALRAAPMPKEPISILVWRGSSTFEVTVNLSQSTKP